MVEVSSRMKLYHLANTVFTVLAAIAAGYVFFGDITDRLQKDLGSQIDSTVQESVQSERNQIAIELEQIRTMRQESEEKLASIAQLAGSLEGELNRVEEELRARVEQAVSQLNSEQVVKEVLEVARAQVKTDVEAAALEFRQDVQAMLTRLETQLPLVAAAQIDDDFYDGLARDDVYRTKYFRWLLDPGEQVPYSQQDVSLPSGKTIRMQKWHPNDRHPPARRLTYQEILESGVMDDFDVFQVLATGGLDQKYCKNDRPPLKASPETMRTLFEQLSELLPRWKDLGVVH